MKLIVTLKDAPDNFSEFAERLNAVLSKEAKINRVSKRVLIVTTETEGDRAILESEVPEIALVESDEEAVPLDLYDESTAYTPTDPLIKQQWNLSAIGAQSAWEYATGKGQTIAVIDSGLDGTHPEFGGNADPRMTAMYGKASLLQFYEPVMSKIRSGNHPKIAPGWSVVDDNDVTFDFQRHGTAVSSVAAAMQNGLGISGVAPNARIAPYVALSDSGHSSSARIMEAMGKILETDLRIVSISLGLWSPMTALATVMEDAEEEGVLVVAACGNNGMERKLYPASYEATVSVGGTGKGHVLWRIPSQGSNWPCDIVAPAAVQPVALKWRGRYTDNQGTSLAAPHVAGVAALCLEIYPDIELSLLKDILFKSGGKSGDDPKWGHGEVNALRAVGLTRAAKGTGKPDWAAIKELQERLTADVAALGKLVERFAPDE